MRCTFENTNMATLADRLRQSVDTALTFDVPSTAHELYFEMRMKRIIYASFIIGNSHGPWQPLLKLTVN